MKISGHYRVHTLAYSSVPKMRAGPNKRAGWNLDKNQISVQGTILLKILIIRDFIYSLNVKKAK